MKGSRIFGTALIALCFLPAVTSANATIFNYYDRAAFTADTGAITVEDFTSTFHFPITTGILNSSTNLCDL